MSFVVRAAVETIIAFRKIDTGDNSSGHCYDIAVLLS